MHIIYGQISFLCFTFTHKQRIETGFSLYSSELSIGCWQIKMVIYWKPSIGVQLLTHANNMHVTFIRICIRLL